MADDHRQGDQPVSIDKLLPQIQNWLQARFEERFRRYSDEAIEVVAEYTKEGQRVFSQQGEYYAPLSQREFHDYLLSVNAPIAETILRCFQAGWILTRDRIGLQRTNRCYVIMSQVNEVPRMTRIGANQKQPAAQSGRVQTSNEDRDKYIYSEACKLTPWKAIAAAVAKNPEWDSVTPQRCRQIANEYADRHNLKRPLKRRHGRPKKPK